MSEREAFDWDEITAAAWTRFQARLADHLVEMDDDDVLLLEVESGDETDGAAPYVQFSCWGNGQLRCEAVSNHYLAPLHQLDGESQGRLLGMGFRPPAWCGNDDAWSANFWVDADRSDGDRLAVLAVQALRDAYGVPHPAFLAGHPFDDRQVPSGTAPAVPVDEEIAAYPSEGFEHLQRLVDDALTPWLGHVPFHDDDGDIPIECGEVIVFVRVLPDRPVVRIFGCVASELDDPARAAVEAGILNRERLFFKFLVLGDAIVMHADLPAWPFAGAQLRDLLQQMCGSVAQIHDDLELRLAAGPDQGGETETESMHPAMHTIIELDAAEQGSVDPRLAASICDYDRDFVLRLLTWNEEQELAWRASLDEALEEGEDDLAEVCSGELEQAERTTALLRAALRLIVERAAARHEQGRSRHSGSRGIPPKPRRRVPDPTLEEVDPEMRNR